jgi:hypothetical protein
VQERRAQDEREGERGQRCSCRGVGPAVTLATSRSNGMLAPSPMAARVASLELDVEGDLDLRAFLGLSDAVRPGYEGIEVRYRVEADAPKEQLEELCAYVQRTSPVLDILTRPVPVTVKMVS